MKKRFEALLLVIEKTCPIKILTNIIRTGNKLMLNSGCKRVNINNANETMIRKSKNALVRILLAKVSFHNDL